VEDSVKTAKKDKIRFDADSVSTLKAKGDAAVKMLIPWPRQTRSESIPYSRPIKDYSRRTASTRRNLKRKKATAQWSSR
jgi:hypothetical protein